MENTVRLYLSGLDSPPSPIFQRPSSVPHSFDRHPWHSLPAYYGKSYSDSPMYARQVGKRNSEETFGSIGIKYAALCIELESFSPMDTHSPVLLKALFSVNFRWLLRILKTPRNLATTLEDL